MTSTDTGQARTYAYVVDETTASRLARAGVRARVRTSAFWAAYLAVPVGLVLITIGTARWPALVGGAVYLVVFPLLMWRSTVRQVRRVAPVGTRIETVFTDEAVTVRMLTGSSTQQFRGLRELCRRGDGVTFQVGASRFIQVLPSACFPDEEIARALAAGAKA